MRQLLFPTLSRPTLKVLAQSISGPLRGSYHVGILPNRALEVVYDVHFSLPSRGGNRVVTKVLVVDDSQTEILLLQSVLQRGGFSSVGISDPTKIEEERPAIILLDVVMPKRNGFQACRDLKNQECYAKIPVVLVTSKATPSDRYWGERQGANGHIAKTFTPEELITAVKRLA